METKGHLTLSGPGVERKLSVGAVLDLAPHCDLWMQGAKTAELRGWITGPDGRIRIKVRPLVMGVPQRGNLRTIESHHIAGQS